jgi:hypothetical protein
MSQPCAIATCKRVSRALCHCCQQNLCITHLNEHNDLLNSQLNPLTDEINVLGERLKTLNTEDILRNCHQKLEQWRMDYHQKIDHFVDKKHQELDRLMAEKVNKQQEEVTHIRSKLAELIRDQEATHQDIDRLASTIRRLEKQMIKIEQTRFSVDSRPLLIDDTVVHVKEIYAEEFISPALSSVYKTIQYQTGSYRVLASNERLLLIHQKPNLCFLDPNLIIVKQVLWPHDVIIDMCWSSTLNGFIVIVTDNIFLVDENTMSIESVQTVEKRNWCSCTCFDNQLFLSTNEWGSSIVEVTLSPSIAVIKEWNSPITCTMDELIDAIVFNNETLAVLIRNKVEKSMRMELRSYKTLDRLWSLTLDIAYKDFASRFGSLDCYEWLVADHSGGRLLHITADGKVKKAITCKGAPYRTTLFGSNMLAISTETTLNFHKI